LGEVFNNEKHWRDQNVDIMTSVLKEFIFLFVEKRLRKQQYK
jgi:hypothetical protein